MSVGHSFQPIAELQDSSTGRDTEQEIRQANLAGLDREIERMRREKDMMQRLNELERRKEEELRRISRTRSAGRVDDGGIEG
jgi:hypothetical protein